MIKIGDVARENIKKNKIQIVHKFGSIHTAY